MKKYCFFMMLAFLNQQQALAKNWKTITKLENGGKHKDAKAGIDKFLSDPKNANEAAAYFYKGKIYNAVSKDSTITPEESMKLKTDAFDAFKKYQQMDAKEVNFILENHGSYFDLYNGYFDIAAQTIFKDTNFSASFEGFKNALAVEDYVKSKNYDYGGFKFPSLDTSLILKYSHRR